jgi:hypothetical protein
MYQEIPEREGNIAHIDGWSSLLSAFLLPPFNYKVDKGPCTSVQVHIRIWTEDRFNRFKKFRVDVDFDIVGISVMHPM